MTISLEITKLKSELDRKVGEAQAQVHNLIQGIEGHYVDKPSECLPTLLRIKEALDAITA